MRSILSAFFVALCLVFLTSGAHAQTVIGNAGPGSSGSFSGLAPTDQSFTVPAGVSKLTAVTIAIGDAGPFDVSLHQLLGGVVGPSLASASFPNSPAVFPNNAPFGPTLPPGGIAVNAGDEFVIRSTSQFTATVSNYYSDGILTINGVPFPGFDGYFTATFEDVDPVPTISEWTMILLGLILAGGAAVMIQRRRFTG